MSNIKKHESFLTLKFSEDWIELNLINLEILEKLKNEYAKDTDKHTEHYRWKVFKEFLEINSSLPESTFFSLYELGNNELDQGMGESMMIDLIRRKDCPTSLIEVATRSGKKSLVKIASKKLLNNPD
jgi:hypothetical protein